MSIMITTPLVIGPDSVGTNELADDSVTVDKINMPEQHARWGPAGSC